MENAALALSQRSRWLAPLALVVGAFAMLFQGLKLLVTNWRLTLVEILLAMWIWAAMLDLKLHVFRGKQFHIIRGPLLIPILLAIASITAASFFLNAVFAFAIAKPGARRHTPSAFSQAREHLRPILSWGFTIGVALWFGAIIVQRWGKRPGRPHTQHRGGGDDVRLLAVPSRLVGIKSARSRRDKLTATAVGGAIGGRLFPSVRAGPGGHPVARFAHLQGAGRHHAGRGRGAADRGHHRHQGHQIQRQAGGQPHAPGHGMRGGRGRG